MNIIIIGGGQLGSRHLQALQKLTQPSTIYVIDPSERSLEICQERFNQIEPQANHKLHLVKSINELKIQEVDFAIIATSSDIRLQVTKALIQSVKIKNLLLEKILFQSISEYSEILEIVSQNKIRTHVNCCMRMQELYSSLKSECGNEPFHYSVKGSNFGLISNIIHYIDHASFLSSSSIKSIDTSKLLPNLKPSKRKGFYELFGTIQIEFVNGSTLVVECSETEGFAFEIVIANTKKRYIIKEAEDLYFEGPSGTEAPLTEKKLNLLYQSSLTNLYIEQILKTGTSQLPTLEESTALHLPLVKSIQNLTKGFSSDSNLFPFT